MSVHRNSQIKCALGDCSADLQLWFSNSEYNASEGDLIVPLTIFRCGSFNQEVEVSLTFTDITAEGEGRMG